MFIKKERQTVIGDGSSTVEELVSIEPEKKEALGILTSGEKKRVPAMGEKVYLNWNPAEAPVVRAEEAEA